MKAIVLFEAANAIIFYTATFRKLRPC